MSVHDIRLECIRLAAAQERNPDRVIEVATKWADFVLGNTTPAVPAILGMTGTEHEQHFRERALSQ